MLARCILAMTLVTSSVQGANILCSGSPLGFSTPDPPYTEADLSFQITLSFGDPLTRVGEGVWVSGPGTYDLSADSHVAAFLAVAANGVPDRLTVGISDSRGNTAWYGDILTESELLGSEDPSGDLLPLPVGGLQMHVWFLSPPGYGVTTSWDVLGVPEPATAASSLLFVCLVLRGRQSRRTAPWLSPPR